MICLDDISLLLMCSMQNIRFVHQQHFVLFSRITRWILPSRIRDGLYPRTLAQRRQCVIELIDKELKEEFLDAMVQLLEQCLQFYGINRKSSDPNVLLRELFATKLQNHEVILEETDEFIVNSNTLS